jgi:tRNA G18 (ribose-2'-O)-methylase SpoU
MGSALLSKICYVDRLENALRQLQTKGRIIVCEQSPRARKLWDCRFDNESIFVFGKEKGGISPEILSFAHEQVIIPMETEVVDSLNVACAAAILFAYFRRS